MINPLHSQPIPPPKLHALPNHILHPAPHINSNEGQSHTSVISPPVQPTTAEASPDGWKTTIENKINSFDAKFDDLVSALRANQQALIAERELNRRHQEVSFPPSYSYPQSRSSTPTTQEFRMEKRLIEDDTGPYTKRRRHDDPEDFRNGFLSIEEARTLFKFFDANISQQLFGFEINKFSVDVIWETSPILICAICTIASMHYPDPSISSKLKALQRYLNNLCAGILFQGRPQTERDGFNTIVALVLCSFWLSDSQRFTGLALQLAKEFGLNKPARSTDKDALSEKDRLKLWYLLYVLDGEQSMTFNRQSLFDAEDYSLKHSRELLLTDRKVKAIKSEPEKTTEEANKAIQETSSSLTSLEKAREKRVMTDFTDLRLVSQVEYNQALSEAFKGNAWDLLNPSAFGIPSKANLELDKWMVSWTVLLAPAHGSVWLSKSTLIYYNFAKMHINCSVVRQLQVDTGNEKVIFPKWENLSSVVEQQKAQKLEASATIEDDDSENSDVGEDEEDEFISNTELINQDETILSLNIAVNAAQTVLNLVLNDNDILNNLKYVPVHIHIMLYYAALLLVNPPTSTPSEEKAVAYFKKIISNLRTIKTLQRKIYLNLPTDKNFGDRFIRSLDDVFSERARILKTEMKDGDLDVSTLTSLLSEISLLQYSNSQLEMMPESNDASCKDSSPKPERISAWPGSNHGHP